MALTNKEKQEFIDEYKPTPNLALLVKELRSTDKKQITGYLSTCQGMCAEGIAVDLFIKKTGIGEWLPYTEAGIGGYSKDEGITWKVLSPKFVNEFYGEGCLYVKIPPHLKDKFSEPISSLVELNDTAKFTFNEIADCIEYTYRENNNHVTL